MSWTARLAVSGLVALSLSLTLSACGERSNDKLTAAPTIEPVGPSDTQSEPPEARGESQPPPLESRGLKEGPYTAEARNRVNELGSGDARTVSEAQRALTRIGRDAVPALVEALEGERHNYRIKQISIAILGEMGVAAEASLPSLKSLKLRGPSELSAMVAPVIYRIEQWQSCGLVGLPGEGEVHLVGLYKGPGRLTLQLGESGHTTTEVDVVVGRTPRPVILVLSAYDPVVWRVGYTLRSSLVGVLVSGYHTQAVIGIPRDAPHRILSYEQTRGCATFYVHNAQNAAQAEPRIMALVGRGIEKYYSSSPAWIGDVAGDSPSQLGNVTYSSDLTVEGYSAVRSDIPPAGQRIDAAEQQDKPRRGRVGRVR